MVDGEPPEELKPELIDPGEPGLLGETQILEQLVDLIRTVKLGSAIGLFGSPGIGKTTICKQLGDVKRDDETTLRYVEVDASESGGTGFRRRLVLKCAKKLGRNEGKVDRRLRGASSYSRFGPPRWRHLLLIPLILLILAVMVGVGLGIAAIVAGVTEDADFDSIANDFVLAMLFAPAVAAAAFGLLVRSVTTEWSMPAPASDDEFVKEFKRLFKHEQDRLLVFVDEIDRSSPDRIADTLDGLRTFFGHEKCVFLVAADRQTLERALSSWLGESTPEHAANPYYGAASAYLDKLFQYQLVVPPLRTNALYQYARSTTKGRHGIWEELEKNDALSRGVIDVLIPPHVTSPRQVNALLNGFALTCHLLERREPDMFDESRFKEVAKLVCLRTEFPLFAADLHVDPRLPQLVLEAARASAGSRAGAQRRERALAYAEGRLPVSTIPLDGGTPADTSNADVDRELRRQQSRQLVAYLDRTRHVQGPRPDIIHAQAFQSELPPKLAEELSEAALAYNTGKLEDAMKAIRADDSEAKALKAERNALDMLSLRARARQESETINALRSLLYVVRGCERPLDAATAELVLGRITSAVTEAAAELTAAERQTLRTLEHVAGNGKAPQGAGRHMTTGAPLLPYS